MHEERSGRPGRRYDDMPKQNQSPVETDYTWRSNGDLAIELIDLALDAEHDGRSGDARIARMAASRLESLTAQKPVVTWEMVERLRIARDQWNANQDKAAFDNLGAAIDQLVALESAPSGVRVKPLEWKNNCAITPFGNYVVEKGINSAKGKLVASFDNEYQPSVCEVRDTEAYAKAAAQADYEHRILSAIEPTQAQGEDDNEKLERYDREIQQALTAPSPDEMEVVGWRVEYGDGRYRFTEVEGDATISRDQSGAKIEPLVRLIDAQAALAAKDGESKRIREILAATDIVALPDDYPTGQMALDRMQRIKNLTLDGLAQIGRRETAEARVAELEKALEWYGEQARLARLIHREGDSGRHALAEDGGKRARAALGGQSNG